jgi:hypothetical protein
MSDIDVITDSMSNLRNRYSLVYADAYIDIKLYFYNANPEDSQLVAFTNVYKPFFFTV